MHENQCNREGNFDTKVEEGGESADIICSGEDAVLIKAEEGTIEGAKSKAEDEHLRIQDE